ncbi:MAG: RNA polymerase sigma factor [Actinomycetota bacterium]
MSVQLPPFQQLLDSHAADVYRFVRAMVGPVDADDVFQETFLAALRAYPSLTDASGLRAWIFTIARHKAVDSFRGAARRAVPTGVLPDEVAVDPARGHDPQLWDGVRALPPKQRAAVVHRYVHDLAYDEIGALLDCSADAARRSVHEGIRKLRTTWQK